MCASLTSQDLPILYKPPYERFSRSYWNLTVPSAIPASRKKKVLGSAAIKPTIKIDNNSKAFYYNRTNLNPMPLHLRFPPPHSGGKWKIRQIAGTKSFNTGEET
jgi:hypothetical protein